MDITNLDDDSGEIKYVQNYNFSQGFCGDSDNTIMEVEVARNKMYETYVGRKSNGEPAEKCLLDLLN